MILRILLIVFGIGALQGCSDVPRPSSEDERNYQASISRSGPAWPHWFPRPAWYTPAYDERDRVVSADIAESIAQCSGGLTMSYSEISGIASDIEDRLRDGELTVYETRNATIGIDFNQRAITADTVELYERFVQCVTVAVGNDRRICERICEDASRGEIEAALYEYEQCMNGKKRQCVRTCTRDFGNEPEDCIRGFCNERLTGNIDTWSSLCEDEPGSGMLARMASREASCKRACY